MIAAHPVAEGGRDEDRPGGVVLCQHLAGGGEAVGLLHGLGLHVDLAAVGGHHQAGHHCPESSVLVLFYVTVSDMTVDSWRLLAAKRSRSMLEVWN